MKTAHEGVVTWGHRRVLLFTGGEGARGVGCHNWEVGKERLQHLESHILIWDDEFVQIFEGKPLH